MMNEMIILKRIVKNGGKCFYMFVTLLEFSKTQMRCNNAAQVLK